MRISDWSSDVCSSDLLGVDAGSYWSQIRANVDIHDLLQSLLKSTVFGAVISWIAVYQGYNAAPTSDGVSRATTSTVVVSSLSILALDFILTAFMFRSPLRASELGRVAGWERG